MKGRAWELRAFLRDMGELGALPAHGALDDRAGSRLARRRPPREFIVARRAEYVRAVEEHRGGSVEDLQADGALVTVRVRVGGRAFEGRAFEGRGFGGRAFGRSSFGGRVSGSRAFGHPAALERGLGRGALSSTLDTQQRFCD